MTMSIATSFDFKTASAHWLARPFILATGCAALADWLFYGWDVGVSLALFLGVVGIVAIFGNRIRLQDTTRIALAVVLAASLLPLIEQVDLLSVTVSILAATMAIIAITSRQPASWQRRLFEAITVPFRGPYRFAGIAIAIAVAVELSRLVHAPWLDDFRLTLAGALLLGRIFSLWNILAYGVGIGLAMVLDEQIQAMRR
jgi:hypothetical protein